MPYKETESYFELTPYGLFRTVLISGVIVIAGVVLIILGFYEKNTGTNVYIYLLILASLFLLGGIIYLVIRLWRYYTGALNTVTLDIEGIRVHNRKTGLQKSLTWDQKPRFSVDEADDTGYPVAIFFSTDNEDETIQINIDDYSGALLGGHKIVEKTKTAVKSFRAKYHKSIK